MKIILTVITFIAVSMTRAGSYESLYFQVANLDVNSMEVYDISGFFHAVDGISMDVSSGEIYFMQDIKSKKIFSVIIGEGNASAMITDEASALNLQKQTEMDHPSFKFSSAMIIADNKFAEMIRNSYPPAQMPNTFEAKNVYREMIDFYLNKKYDLIEPDLIRAIKDKKEGRYFSLNLKSDDDIFTLEYNEYEALELSIYKNVETRGNVDSYKRPLVNVNGMQDTIKRNFRDNYRVIEVNKLISDMELEGEDLLAKAKATLKCTRLDDSQSYLPFSLASGLEVDSLIAGGVPITDYYRDEDLGILVFDLPDEIKGEFDIELIYQGEVLKHYFNFIMYSYSWYPNYPNSGDIAYEINITHPSKYMVTGTGDIQISEVNEFTDKTTLTSDIPIESPVFEIGKFEKETREIEGNIKLNFYFEDNIDIDDLESYFEKSFQIFTDILGKLPMNEFNILIPRKNPQSQGAAFNMNSGSGNTGGDRDNSDLQNYVSGNFLVMPYVALERYPLLAVESRASNFWFNQQFFPDSYREAWVYIGLQNYLSLLLMESFPDYARRLENQQNTIKNDYYMLYDEHQPGPISLGGLISKTNRNLFGYTVLKSIKFFHMLRNLSYDFQNMNEKPFMSIIKNTFNAGVEGHFTEQDFINTLSGAFGTDLSWYVRQWTILDYVPKIEYAIKKEKSGGNVNVQLAIKKSECPKDFVVSIPVLVIFEDDSFYKTNFNVQNELSIVDLIPLPDNIKEIIINEKDFQIGDFEEEDWEDIVGAQAGE
jgi:hypothetical protein